MFNNTSLSPNWTQRTTQAFTISAAVTLSGCASLPEQVNSFYDKNKGLVTGAMAASAAAAAGCALKGENIVKCAVIGAVAGGIGGHLWDLRQKKLQDTAEKHNLTITTETTNTRNDQYIATTGKSDQSGSDVKNSMSTVIKDSGMFATSSSKLTNKSRDAFKEIAVAYKTDDDTKLLIIGHTDGTGSAEFNQQLSEKRAQAVAKLFIDMGIPEGNIYYQGAGESRPIATNNSTEGRQQNRRVEIVETDSEASVIAYNIAKTRDKKNLLFTDIDDHKKAAKKNTLTKAVLDFAGAPVNSTDLDFYDAVVSVPKPSNTIPFVSQAVADNNPESPKPVACYKDAPRISGSIIKAGNAARVDTTKYAIREHVPGLGESAVQARVNGHNIGLGPVSVLRNTYTAPSAPNLFLHKNNDGSSGKADFKYQTVINTYEGIDNFLYRVFVVGKQPAIQCMDLLYPKDGGTKATAGAIFYQANGFYTAEFRPVKL